MQKVDQQVIATIITAVVILIFIGVVMLLLAVYYTNSKKRFLVEQENLKSNFQKELLQAQLEIQEQTFYNISQEIHDNIGQVLSLVKLNLGTISRLSDEEKDERISESKELVSQTITDLRDLSKSLSKDSIATKGFTQTIQTEVERINKSGVIDIQLSITGEIISLGEQRELVLFRILQESINNSLKHADANYLKISLQYCNDLFTLTLLDDGLGFDSKVAESKGGLGLKNIRNRANLIGAEVRINSVVGHGSEITVQLNPIDKQPYARGNHSGSDN